jgi:hypothetical protein
MFNDYKHAYYKLIELYKYVLCQLMYEIDNIF